MATIQRIALTTIWMFRSSRAEKLSSLEIEGGWKTENENVVLFNN